MRLGSLSVSRLSNTCLIEQKNAGSSGVFLCRKNKINDVNNIGFNDKRDDKTGEKISPADTGPKSGDKDPYVRTFEMILVCNTNVIQV